MNTLKLKLIAFIICLLSLAHTSLCQNPDTGTVSGVLKYLKAPNGRVFLAIDSTRRLSAKADDGTLVTSKLLQLAIPDPELGKKAMGLIGKEVKSQGSPMARHTQHHHTEVLWVVSSLEESLKEKTPADTEKPKPQGPSLNQHSVEW